MFSSKLTTLFNGSNTKQHLSKSHNKNNITYSENGALKYISTGNAFVDQFSLCGSYLNQRNYSDIEKDCNILFKQDPINAVKFIIYLRTITRKTLVNDKLTESVQRGTGLKHESIMRMLWLYVNHEELFWKNINLFIAVGSWDDIFTMLKYDLIYQNSPNKQNRLDWNLFGQYLLTGLQNENSSELIKKYLPQIKSTLKCNTIESQANTIIGKWFTEYILGDLYKITKEPYKEYRKFKSGGKAHIWQQKISQQKFDEIDFNTIHGRALKILVNSKFLENQNLESQFIKWIDTKPVAKFTGWPHELFKNIESINKDYKKQILNKQFTNLVNIAKDNTSDKTSMIVVRDTSGSMGQNATGCNQSCFDIAKALSFFSEMLNTGHFANKWIEFNHTAKVHKWIGNSPFDKWMNDNSDFIGDTNFFICN